MSQKKVHNVAMNAWTNESNAQLYDVYRPTYHPDTLLKITKECHLGAATDIDTQYDVLELGSGTGKFTIGALEHFPKGTRYLASEPLKELKDLLEKNVNGRADIAQFSSDKIPLPDKSVKSVICAQCFHWFATEECLKEIHRVLVPGGALVLVWNMRDRGDPFTAEVHAIMSAYDKPGVPQHRDGAYVDPLFKSVSYLFQLPEKVILNTNLLQGDDEFFQNYVCSFSQISVLPDTEKAKIRKQVSKSYIKNASSEEKTLSIKLYTDIRFTRSI